MLHDKLLFLNAGVLTLSFMDIEQGLRILLLVLTIIISIIRILKYLRKDADSKTSE